MPILKFILVVDYPYLQMHNQKSNPKVNIVNSEIIKICLVSYDCKHKNLNNRSKGK